jgi:hypothetical protein
MIVAQIGLDFARPSDSGLIMVGEENAAPPHFPHQPNLKPNGHRAKSR